LSRAVTVANLSKNYGRIKALDDISFEVDEREIFGFLGPNGAGKTTAIKIMLGLTRAAKGHVEIFGIDVQSKPDKARENIGYVSQNLSLSNEITGYENLLISAKLYGVPSSIRKSRITEIMDLLGIQNRADDLVKKYSGGMMRRLEIGAALVHRPKLLILDEPTIGLDPQIRLVVRELLRRLVNEFGITIFLTTHDMGEADELCEKIAIINNGRIGVVGTPTNLKRSVGGDTIQFDTKEPEKAVSILTGKFGVTKPIAKNNTISMIVNAAETILPLLINTLARAGVIVDAIHSHRPTLDDVFLKYAGSRLADVEREGDYRHVKEVRRTFRRMR